MSLDINCTVRKECKSLKQAAPFEKIKDSVLGKNYELSLVFIGEKKAVRINKENRKKDYVPNVLSFSIGKNIGEIFICPSIAEKEARAEGVNKHSRILFLYIHGLLHLKGLPHGVTMERKELELLRRFSI